MEIFMTLFEAQVLIENWGKDCNQIKPQSALGYRSPVSEAIMPGYGSTSLTLSVVLQLGAGHPLDPPTDWRAVYPSAYLVAAGDGYRLHARLPRLWR